MALKTTVTTSVGRQAYGAGAAELISRRILEGIATAPAFDKFKRELNSLRLRMEKAGNAEAKRLIPFIRGKMMKIQSPRFTTQGDKDFRTITVEEMEAWADEMKAYNVNTKLPMGSPLKWKSLTYLWLQRKGFGKPFFRGKTDQLYKELGGATNWPIMGLGGVKVTLERYLPTSKEMAKFSDRRFLLAQMKVRIFPNARTSTFPGLGTGSWSDVNDSNPRLPGLSALSNRKLYGGKMTRSSEGRRFQPHRRPMITPAAQFWALYRIPMALKNASRASLTRSKIYGGADSSAPG